MSGSYIPILRQLFLKAKIVLDRFHIIQHLSRAMKKHWKILDFSDELRYYYELYQLLLFHFQEKNTGHFMALIDENLPFVNPAFSTVFKTFKEYKVYIANALELPYFNAKLEATNKLIKDIKRQAFGFRNFKNFKTKILIALNIKIERTNLILSRC